MLSSLQQLIDSINFELPQTQCEKCGFKGCLPYAQALANGEGEINRCPPGGQAVINKLSALLNRPPLVLDKDCGLYQPPQLMKIVESLCIGCTKCIQICPVDAIIGAKKWMHTIIAEDCTGCELCILVCPLDCIETIAVDTYKIPADTQIGLDIWMKNRAINARKNIDIHSVRIEKRARATETVLPQITALAESANPIDMKNFIALARKNALEKYHNLEQDNA